MSGLMALFSEFASEEEKAEFAGGVDQLGTVTIDLLKSLRLWDKLTARERRLFETNPDAISEEDREHVRAEADALICLAWALGRVDELPTTDDPTDGSALSEMVAADDADDQVIAFLEQATLRPEWEITGARDAVAAQARAVNGSNLVLATRLKALDWMCGSLPLTEWDDSPPREL